MKTRYDPENVLHHNQNICPRSERTAASALPQCD
jgi:Berberine and berberine like